MTGFKEVADPSYITIVSSIFLLFSYCTKKINSSSLGLLYVTIIILLKHVWCFIFPFVALVSKLHTFYDRFSFWLFLRIVYRINLFN